MFVLHAGKNLGRKVKLCYDINIAKGTFLRGSVIVVSEHPQSRYDLRDVDTGEMLYNIGQSNGDNTDAFFFME